MIRFDKPSLVLGIAVPEVCAIMTGRVARVLLIGVVRSAIVVTLLVGAMVLLGP